MFKISRGKREAGSLCGKPAVVKNYAKNPAVEGEYFCHNCASNKEVYADRKKLNKSNGRKERPRERTRRLYNKNKNNRKSFHLKKTKSTNTNSRKQSLSSENIGVDFGSDNQDDLQDTSIVSHPAYRYLGSHLVANENASFNFVEHLFKLFRDEKMITKALSRSSLTRIIVEAGVICQHAIATLVGKMEGLVVALDDSPKENGRSFRIIKVEGIIPENDFLPQGLCSLSAGIHEIVEKTADSMVNDVKQDFERIEKFQKENGQKSDFASILQITGVACDWTSSNTGVKGGFVTVLNNERREKDVSSKDVTLQGCTDHLLSLVAKHFYTDIVEPFFLQLKVTDPVPILKSFTKLLSGNLNQTYRGFMAKVHNIRNAPAAQTSENRYCSVFLACQFLSKYKNELQNFTETNSLPTENIRALWGAYQQEAINMMSNVAGKIFLPSMKKFAEISTFGEYKKEMNELLSNMKVSLQSFDGFKTTWDLAYAVGEEKDMKDCFENIKEDINALLEKINGDDFINKSKTRAKAHEKEEGFIYKKNAVKSINPAQFHLVLCIEFAFEMIYTIKQKIENLNTQENVNDETFLKATTRDVEGGFSWLNSIYKKHPLTNRVVMDSIFAIRTLTGGDWGILKKVVGYFHKESLKKDHHWFKDVKTVGRNILDENGNSRYAIEKYNLNIQSNLVEKNKEIVHFWTQKYLEKIPRQSDEEKGLSEKPKKKSKKTSNNPKINSNDLQGNQTKITNFFPSSQTSSLPSELPPLNLPNFPENSFEIIATKPKGKEGAKSKKNGGKGGYLKAINECQMYLHAVLKKEELISGLCSKSRTKKEGMEKYLQYARIWHEDLLSKKEVDEDFDFGSTVEDNGKGKEEALLPTQQREREMAEDLAILGNENGKGNENDQVDFEETFESEESCNPIN